MTETNDGGFALFDFRSGERVKLHANPALDDFDYLVMLHDIQGLPEPTVSECSTGPNKGGSVEAAVVVAASKRQDGRWRWMQASPWAKELIGGMLDNLGVRNEWVGMRVLPRGEEVSDD